MAGHSLTPGNTVPMHLLCADAVLPKSPKRRAVVAAQDTKTAYLTQRPTNYVKEANYLPSSGAAEVVVIRIKRRESILALAIRSLPSHVRLVEPRL